jgi:two-component system response regulator PilR (NtrC family)
MDENFRALRVLVIEGESLIRWSITETLASAGHNVIGATDGTSAIVALRNAAEPIDAILLDLRLPDANDLTLLSTIRRLSPHSAVVLMTAVGTSEMIQEALNLGVYHVLHKPFEMQSLEPLLREACRNRPVT